MSSSAGLTRPGLNHHQQVSWWRRRRLTERLEAQPTDRPGDGHSEATALRLSLVNTLRGLTPRQSGALTAARNEMRTD
ncbi:hypothetical protein [Micromonospora sp. NPDC005171]|uniref:hypothetical protein n=1 Tax=Micromonospora sp. NPDC005171 TaxID=3156866 RepID=UPI0033BE0206